MKTVTYDETQWKLVPVDRSYDMRAKAIIAFNTAEQAGQDRDDALDAAFPAELQAAPTPSADGRAHRDTSDYVSCACGDMYPPDSYEAGYIHGAGQCENCEAGLPHAQAIRNAALEEAALWIRKRADDYDAEHGSTDPETGTREYPGDGEEYVGELQEIEDGIRALKSQPADSAQDREDAQRYRSLVDDWLQDRPGVEFLLMNELPPENYLDKGDIDAAIDAARAAKEPNHG